MSNTSRVGRLAAGAVAVALLSLIGPSADAAPIDAGSASSFAVTADALGENVTPPTPTAEITAPAVDEVNNTVVDIPGSPLIINGTLIARSALHVDSDLLSELSPSAAQPLAGPYNARSIGQIEDLRVLINEDIPGGQLVSVDLIRSEAVAVCSAGVPTYSANSEVVNLQIGDQDPLSGPLTDILKQITEGLAPLADLVKVDLNVVTPTPTGVSVDAVVVTLLQAAAENGSPGPLAKVVLGHAEVSGVNCAITPTICPDCQTTTTILPAAPVPTLPVTGGSGSTQVALVLLVAAACLYYVLRGDR